MNTRKGFTLVEILIVVVLLGLFVAIVLPQIFNEDELIAEYSKVREYLGFDYYVKMEYSKFDGKIHLVREDNYKLILPLNYGYFLRLKKKLEEGGDLGTWTFESEEKSQAPGALGYLVWYGTRKTEN